MNSRKKPSHTESINQRALIQWARIYKSFEPPRADRRLLTDYLFAIPNGGKRNAREAALMKAEGVKSGVSDLFLPIPRGKYTGLWIELKVNGNKATPNQLDWGETMEACGYRFSVCQGWEEAKQEIVDYLGLSV